MKEYLVYVDILGYANIARELANSSGFDENIIRQYFMSDELERGISNLKSNYGDKISIVEGTDDKILIISDLDIVFEIIKQLTSLKIPHKLWRNKVIPLEIAIDVIDTNPDDNTEYKNKGAVIDALKNDIVTAYRNDYFGINREKVKDTYIVHTKSFLDELALSHRDFFSNQIIQDGKEFYLAETFMMQQVDSKIFASRRSLHEFEANIDVHNHWSRFDARFCLLKDPNEDRWILRFLYVHPNNNEIIESNFRSGHLRLIRQINNADNIIEMLNQISTCNNVNLDGVPASLELMSSALEYRKDERSNTYQELFHLSDIMYALAKTGNSTQKTREIERILRDELPQLGYVELRDAFRNELGFDLGMGAVSPCIFFVFPQP